VYTPFPYETGGIRGFQSLDPSVNRTAVGPDYAIDLCEPKATRAVFALQKFLNFATRGGELESPGGVFPFKNPGI
jgi:hypothetical protein